MNKVINPTPLGGGGGGLQPTIRATAPVGSSVTCDGQTKVVGAEGYVDFVVSAEPVNILPDGVQGLESIESTGDQYIITNYYPNNNTRIITSMAFSQLSNTKWGGFGGAYGDVNRSFSVYQYNNKFYAVYGNSEQAIDGLIANHFYDIDFNKQDVYIDSSQLHFQTVSFASPSKLALFACNRNGTIYKGYVRNGRFKVYDNVTDAVDLIPCIYNSQVGMWDVVSNSFFGNQGTGSFIAGEPKEYLDYPTYTVTVNGTSKSVMVDKTALFCVNF